jgi:hypothetical protein
MAYSSDPVFYHKGTAELFEALRSGWRATIGGEFALADAAIALDAVERGTTTGSILLIPDAKG